MARQRFTSTEVISFNTLRDSRTVGTTGTVTMSVWTGNEYIPGGIITNDSKEVFTKGLRIKIRANFWRFLLRRNWGGCMSLIRGDGGGALDIPSDQIFNSNAERDTFFTNNPAKLFEGAQCVVLTSPPEGLYQVYTSGSWENRSAIIQGPQGEKGDAGGLDFTNLSPNTVPIVNDYC